MPKRLTLTNNDGTETIDLLYGALRVYNWNWDTQPTSLQQRITQLPFGIQASSLGYPQVVETLSLATFGCGDEVRAAIRELEEFLENAKAHMDDPVDGDPHWLEWLSEGEHEITEPVPGVSPAVTAGKRALVCGGTWQWISQPPSSWQMLDGTMLLLRLALTRHPLWEATEYATTQSGVYGVNTVGGTLDFTNIAGRVPARIALTELSTTDVAQADAITDVWMGIRQEGHGLTNFVPVWECESTAVFQGNSTLGLHTLDSFNDAAYHNSFYAETTFIDANLDRRLYINVLTVNGAVAGCSHFAGRYLVLCRCHISDDTEWVTIQMRNGYAGGPLAVHDPVQVYHEAALYRELGQIQIPPPGIWDALETETDTDIDEECTYFTIELWAQSPAWEAGDTHTLRMDCLVLIPCDFFVKVEDAWIFTDIYDQRDLAIVRNPDERIFGYMYGETGNVRPAGTVMPNQWYLPEGDSVLVLAGQRADEQVIGDDLDITLHHYPRWMSYRE